MKCTVASSLACLLGACSFVFPPGHRPSSGRCLPVAPIIDTAIVVAGVAIPVIFNARYHDEMGTAFVGAVTVPIGAVFLIPMIYGFRKFARCEPSPPPRVPLPDGPVPAEHCGVDGSCVPIGPRPPAQQPE